MLGDRDIKMTNTWSLASRSSQSGGEKELEHNVVSVKKSRLSGLPHRSTGEGSPAQLSLNLALWLHSRILVLSVHSCCYVAQVTLCS